MDKLERRLIALVVLIIIFRSNVDQSPSCEEYGLSTGAVHFNHKTNMLTVECK